MCYTHQLEQIAHHVLLNTDVPLNSPFKVALRLTQEFRRLQKKFVFGFVSLLG